MRYAKLLCWLFFSTYFFSEFALAVYFTEVHPTQEYIELSSDTDVDLSGYWYSEMTASGKENLYPMPFSSLSAGQYAVIVLNNKINDTGDTISLYSPEKQKIDTVTIPAKKDNLSYTFFEGVWNWAKPTQGSAFIPEPTPESVSEDVVLPELVLSEMLPDPAGTDGEANEFFEIENKTNTEVVLKNWSVADASGKKFVFTEERIAPNGFLVVYRSQSKITLNNNAETLTLFSPTGKIVSQLSFSQTALPEKSFGVFASESCWQQSTPALQNASCFKTLFSPVFSAENSFFLVPPLSVKTNPVVLQITSVRPQSSPDAIEVLCKQCGVDLAGIRLYIDGVAFTIPKDTFAETGDILRFVFEKETTKPPEKMGKGWLFFVPVSGLSMSDETIMLLDGDSVVMDGLCYANQNNYFESKEKKEISFMILQNQWNGDLQEHGCVNISVFPKNAIIVRKNDADTNTKDDFEIRVFNDTDEKVPQDGLKISAILVSSEYFEVKIKNISSSVRSLKNVGFYNAGKEMLLLPALFLFPQQEAIVKLKTKNKRLPLDNMLLELRDARMHLLDSACFNWVENTISANERQHLEEALRFHKWDIDFHLPLCFSNYSADPFLFVRTSFDRSGVSAFEKTKSDTFSFFAEPIKQKTKKKPKNKKTNKSKKEPKKKTIPLKNQIFSLQISKVLPNPNGTDSGKEVLFLQNISARSGFLSGWKLKIIRKGKTTTKKLPTLFFMPFQVLAVYPPFLPSLPNTDTTLVLLNEYGEEVDRITYTKARVQEWFGHNAPKFFEKAKKKKKSKKKSKKIKKALPAPSSKKVFLSGVISFADDEMVLIRAGLGWYAMKFPSYLPYAHQSFSVGSTVVIHLVKGKIKDIRPEAPSTQGTFFLPEASLWSGGVFAGFFVVMGSGLWFLARKKKTFKK